MKPPSNYEAPLSPKTFTSSKTTRPILGPLRVSTSAPSSSSVGDPTLHRNQLFDLDGLQIKKLQQLIKHSHVLHATNSTSKGSLSESKRKQKIIDIEMVKMEECRLRRYEMSAVSSIHHFAAVGDEFNLREQLMTDNFNVNERDVFNGRTVLITACVAGQSHIVRMLLRDYNVEVNRTSLLGEQSPLHFSVIAGSRPIVLLLLTSHANVNARDRRGCTPLHLVNSQAVIKLILKNGADPSIRSNEVFAYLRIYVNT